MKRHASLSTAASSVPWNWSTNLNAVAWCGTRFVAVADALAAGSPEILLSDDGATWTAAPAGRTSGYGWLTAVACSESRFVAVGTYASAALVLTSADGLTWTEVQTPLPFAPADVAWTGSGFVAVGYGFVGLSPDGSTWSVTSTGNLDLHAVTSSPSRLLAVGTGTFTSRDGVTWTQTPGPPGLQGVAWSGLEYVAVGFAGTIATSP